MTVSTFHRQRPSVLPRAEALAAAAIAIPLAIAAILFLIR